MIRLAVVELRRYGSRRLAQVLVALLLLAIGVTGAIVAWHSRPLSAAQLDDARLNRRSMIEECVDHPRRFAIDPSTASSVAAACASQAGAVAGWVSDPRYHLSSLRDTFLGTSVVVSVLGLVIGASFVGAEWRWGTIGTLLTWEPRRTRVLLVKLAVCAAATFALFIASQAVLGLVLWLVAATRGVTDGTGTGSWFRSVAGVLVRSAALGAFSAAVGAAVATVGRNTAAALGVGFVYFGVVEGLIRGLRPAWQPWLVGDNATLFLTGVDNRFPPLDRTMTSSGLLLLAYAGVLVAVAVAWFRVRDVA